MMMKTMCRLVLMLVLALYNNVQAGTLMNYNCESFGVGAVSSPPYFIGASKFIVSPFSFFASKRKFPFQFRTIFFLFADILSTLKLASKNFLLV